MPTLECEEDEEGEIIFLLGGLRNMLEEAKVIVGPYETRNDKQTNKS